MIQESEIVTIARKYGDLLAVEVMAENPRPPIIEALLDWLIARSSGALLAHLPMMRAKIGGKS